MSTTAYWAGTTLIVDWAVTDIDGDVVSSATVTGSVELPDGTDDAMTAAWVAADQVYRASYTPEQAGWHSWRLEATGTATGAVEGRIFVQQSMVGSPPADMLCTAADLAAVLQLGDDVDVASATVLIEAATAVVQEACDSPPQRLVWVEDDEFEMLGDIGSWLELPQRPVASIAELTVDGEVLVEDEDFRRFGSRLWRERGWQTNRWEPSKIAGIYSHGHPAGAQGLQLARNAVLSLIRGVYGNPEGAIAVRIDDYSASYGKFAAAMDASEYLARALQRQYGRRAALVRLG